MNLAMPEVGNQDPSDTTQVVADALRAMLMQREFGPGQQLRQEDLAERLGVSRSPVREALRLLESEGLVEHIRNRGHFVVHLCVSEIAQVYRMRSLLETDVIATLPRADGDALRRLTEAERAVKAAVKAGSVGRMLSANRDFHFVLFLLSPNQLIVREIARLWDMVAPYHSAYLWQEETRAEVLMDHAEIVAAVRSDDRKRLVRETTVHRKRAEDRLIELLEAWYQPPTARDELARVLERSAS